MASTNQHGLTADQLNSQAARIIINSNPTAAGIFPEPPETVHGLPVEHTSTLRQLRDHGVIEKVRRCLDSHEDCPNESTRPCKTFIWRATHQGYELIQRQLEERALLDCGHPPFSNPRERDGYSCTDDECDALYSRDEIEEVLN